MASDLRPIDNLVGPLLTDLYQLTMAYGYWQRRKHEDRAVFDLFFRKCPFGGEFAVFAGLEEVLRFVSSYRFTDDQIAYVRSQMPGRDPGFFEWLRSVDCRQLRIRALREGTLAFARVPLLTVEGPLAAAQLLETTLLTLVNYATLVATNAARFRLAAGPGKTLVEFGLRRAQGPDGGVSASRYTYLGGFDATSDMAAGQLFGISVSGTHAHSWVQAFVSLDEVRGATLPDAGGRPHDFVALVLACREELGFTHTNDEELAAFIGYALAWPDRFLALVDTYDTLRSGVPNFLAVAVALRRLGYRPLGIRLDSGDLAYLSKEARRMFREAGERAGLDLSGLTIVASNELDEDTLLALRQQGHEVDAFGIGTHLVTCRKQPALGGIYKLVEIAGRPRIKVSEDPGKTTIPGRKEAYRLIGREGYPLADLMMQAGEEPPRPGQPVLCRHPFEPSAQAYVVPTRVVPLHELVWDGRPNREALRPLAEARAYVLEQLARMRPDHLRPLNPTPYKVAVSERLYRSMHELWRREMPVKELR